MSPTTGIRFSDHPACSCRYTDRDSVPQLKLRWHFIVTGKSDLRGKKRRLVHSLKYVPVRADTCQRFTGKKWCCLQLTEHKTMLAALASCQHCNLWWYAAEIQLPSTCLNTRSNIKSRRTRVANTNSRTYQFNYYPSLSRFYTFVIRSFFSSYAPHYLVSLVFSSYYPLNLFLSFSSTSFRSLILIFPSDVIIPPLSLLSFLCTVSQYCVMYNL